MKANLAQNNEMSFARFCSGSSYGHSKRQQKQVPQFCGRCSTALPAWTYASLQHSNDLHPICCMPQIVYSVRLAFLLIVSLDFLSKTLLGFV